MTNRVEQVTIVGGGTAGWLTALVLGTFLNRWSKGPPVQITLIESPKVPTVGVGEATLASLQLLMKPILRSPNLSRPKRVSGLATGGELVSRDS